MPDESDNMQHGFGIPDSATNGNGRSRKADKLWDWATHPKRLIPAILAIIVAVWTAGNMWKAEQDRTSVNETDIASLKTEVAGHTRQLGEINDTVIRIADQLGLHETERRHARHAEATQ